MDQKNQIKYGNKWNGYNRKPFNGNYLIGGKGISTATRGKLTPDTVTHVQRVASTNIGGLCVDVLPQIRGAVAENWDSRSSLASSCFRLAL